MAPRCDVVVKRDRRGFGSGPAFDVAMDFIPVDLVGLSKAAAAVVVHLDDDFVIKEPEVEDWEIVKGFFGMVTLENEDQLARVRGTI
jgi:hypothetical protein